jgi:hypothetical protein
VETTRAVRTDKPSSPPPVETTSTVETNKPNGPPPVETTRTVRTDKPGSPPPVETTRTVRTDKPGSPPPGETTRTVRVQRGVKHERSETGTMGVNREAPHRGKLPKQSECSEGSSRGYQGNAEADGLDHGDRMLDPVVDLGVVCRAGGSAVANRSRSGALAAQGARVGGSEGEATRAVALPGEGPCT